MQKLQRNHSDDSSTHRSNKRSPDKNLPIKESQNCASDSVNVSGSFCINFSPSIYVCCRTFNCAKRWGRWKTRKTSKANATLTNYTDLGDSFLKDQNLNPISPSYHIFYLKSQQNKEETFSTFIKSQISSNTSITVFSAEDLNSFKRSLDTKVTVEYNEDLVDRNSRSC